MSIEKQGGIGVPFIALLLFGSVLMTGAVVLESEENGILENESLENSSEIIIIGNLSVIEINESIPIDDPTIESQENESIKPEESISLVEKHKGKLNDVTRNIFKNSPDKKQEKEFLVKFRGDSNKFEKVKIQNEYRKFNLGKIKGKMEDVEKLLEDPEIYFIEIDQNIAILEEIPNNIIRTGAPYIWNSSKGIGVKIAILDTGIASHSDLSIVDGISIVSEDYIDINGHGTAVAGVISSILNNDGLAGVAPEASIYAVKIMQGSSGSLSDAIEGVEWAIGNDMDIISMSFGLETYSQIFKDVLEEAYNEGILLAAASGNNGEENILYPAAYDSVIAVGAIDSNDQLAPFSSFGNKQELVAQGVSINSTSLDNGYAVSSGTSLAAPHVTGVAALIKSYNNSLSNEEIRAKLRNDALDLGESGKDDYFGYGLVQAQLEINNFTFVNNSYYYEIFNISNYGLSNVTFNFWLSGNGSIDDVDFMPGYYLGNLTFQSGVKKSYYYNVSENGSLFTLSATLFQTDNFTDYGTSAIDGIGWVNEPLTHKIDSPFISEAECFYLGSTGGDYDYCFFDTSPHKAECEFEDSPYIDCGSGTQCSIVGSANMEQPRNVAITSSANMENVLGWSYDDCSNQLTKESTGALTYYIISKKRARCVNNTGYVVEGFYGGSSWVQLGQSICTENSICSNDLINITNKNQVIESGATDPCALKTTCSGTVQIIAEDKNGNSINGTNIFKDGQYVERSNEYGIFNSNFTTTCQQTFIYNVSCANNQSSCGQKTAAFESNNDYEGLIFDCSICVQSPDFHVDIDDVKTNKGTDQVTINLSLVGSFSATNVNITFKVQSDEGLIAKEASQFFNISSSNKFKFITQSITLNDNDDFIHVYIDTKNKVSESNEKNNYAIVPLFERTLNAYLDIGTGFPKADSEIAEYLKLFVNNVSESQADVVICIGRKCGYFNKLNAYTLNKQSPHSFIKKHKYGRTVLKND